MGARKSKKEAIRLRDRASDESVPDVIPETPPRSSKKISENNQHSGKRKAHSSSDEEKSEELYQPQKKTRMTHFLKKKPVIPKKASDAFFSSESGSEDDGNVNGSTSENGENEKSLKALRRIFPQSSEELLSKVCRITVSLNGAIALLSHWKCQDVRNDKAEPSSPQREALNSPSSSTCESPMFFTKKKRNHFRIDSNEKDMTEEREVIRPRSSCKKLGLSDSESGSENEDDNKPKGPFPRIRVVANLNSESEDSPKREIEEQLSNGHAVPSYSKSRKSLKTSSSSKNSDKNQLKSFARDCVTEDNATDESFNVDMDDFEDFSSDEEFEFGTAKKRKILEFFENITVDELSSVHTCSKKKAEKITSQQPFKSWDDLVQKLNNVRNIALNSFLPHCLDLMKERKILQSILTECSKISEKLNSEIKCLHLEDHMTKGEMVLKSPTTIPSHLKLKPYQLVGLNWMALLYRNGVNGVLADEMGLGKTIQTISFLAHLFENDPNTGPHLIVVPSSTLDNWNREFSLWCPSMAVTLYRGSQMERKSIRTNILRKIDSPNVIILTYSVSSPQDRMFLRKIDPHYAIFDEGHMLKNMSTQRYMQLMKIKASRKLLLTGTPLQNNLLELMSLLRFIMPHMFEQTTDTLMRLFSTNSDNTSMFAQNRIKDAKAIMQPFVLRRLKEDVLKQLPDKERENIFCEMTVKQKEQYDNTREMFKLKLHKNSSSELKSAFIELRKMANHPLLRRKHYTLDKLRAMAKLLKKDPNYYDSNEALIVEDMEVMTDFELHVFCQTTRVIRTFSLDDVAVMESGKFNQLDKLLPQFQSQNERVVLFSQFKLVLDIIEKYLGQRKYKFVRLDGNTKVDTRLDIIDKFNKDESIFIFLLSTKAGGLGINLTSANIVIIHDIDMNPYNDKQAEDRCHRLGQTKSVKIIRLLSKGTIEEGMLRCAENKLKLEKEMTGNGDDSTSIASLLEETMR